MKYRALIVPVLVQFYTVSSGLLNESTAEQCFANSGRTVYNDAYPYAISLERKSVGRIVKSLLSEDQLNLREDATGVWYEAGCNFPKAS